MKISEQGLKLIKKYEGFYSKPYLDPVGIPTIGYGIIKYPNGKRVTMRDKPLTEKEASDMLMQLLNQTYVPELSRLVKKPLNQSQIDALTSFIYNLGGTNLSKSTLLKKINSNPNDPSIRQEFLKWNKAGGKVLNGLTKRRQEEADLYFSNFKVTLSDLNLREDAGTQFKVLKVLPKGTEVEVIQNVGNWSKVYVPKFYKKGWVSNKYIS